MAFKFNPITGQLDIDNVAAPGATTWGAITGTLSAQTDLQAALDAKNYKVFYTVGSSNADYITDGTADDVQIQQAINAANATGGGIVHIKEGTYDITAILGYYSNMIIEGDGWGTKLKIANGANLGYILNGVSKSNVVIRDMELDGNKANQTAPNIGTLIGASLGTRIVADNIYAHDNVRQGIYWGGVTKSVIKNCYSANNGGTLISSRQEGFGFGLNESSGTPSTDNIIVNCVSDSNYEGGYSIYSGNLFDGSTAYSGGNVVDSCIALNSTQSIAVGFNLFSVTNNAVVGCVADGCTTGIQLYNANNCAVTGNQILQTGANYGIFVNSNANNNEISGNYIEGGNQQGINMSNSYYNVVSGNKVTLSGTQGMQLGSGSSHNTITGNSFARNQRDGILVSGGTHNTITGNSFVNNSQRGVGLDSGLILKTTSTYNVVTGNSSYDDQTLDTSSLTANASSGQAAVTVASTTSFAAGQLVTISDSTPQSENRQILSIDSATQFTLTANLTNSYTTASSALVTGRATQKYGIREDTTADDYNVISSNICTGNTTAQVSYQGVSSEIGHNIEA